VRFSDEERVLLRQQALSRWQRSRVLRLRAAEAQARAQERIGRAARAVARSKELQRNAPGSVIGDAAILMEGPTAQAIDHLADQVIRQSQASSWTAGHSHEPSVLVASGHLAELLRLRALASGSFPWVLEAGNAGTALGLAVALQPEAAIIDTRLDLADGMGVALALPLYAPRTKVLVLVDDPDRSAAIENAGFEAAPHGSPDAMVQSWIEKVAS